MIMTLAYSMWKSAYSYWQLWDFLVDNTDVDVEWDVFVFVLFVFVCLFVFCFVLFCFLLMFCFLCFVCFCLFVFALFSLVSFCFVLFFLFLFCFCFVFFFLFVVCFIRPYKAIAFNDFLLKIVDSMQYGLTWTSDTL